MKKSIIIGILLAGVLFARGVELSGAIKSPEATPVSELLDAAAVRRAAAYAGYASAIHALSREEEKQEAVVEAMDRYVAALAGVDDPLPVFYRVVYLMRKHPEAIKLDEYYPKLKTTLLARTDAAYAPLCLAALELERNDLEAAQPLLQPFLSAGGDQTVLALQILGGFFLRTQRNDELAVLVSQIERTPEQRDRVEFHTLRLCSHIRSGHREQALALVPVVVEEPYTYGRLDMLGELSAALESLGILELEDAFVEKFMLYLGGRMPVDERTKMLHLRIAKALKADNLACVDRTVAMIAAMQELPDSFVDKCTSAMLEKHRTAKEPYAKRVYADCLARLMVEEIRRHPAKEDALLKELVAVYRILHRSEEAMELLQRIPPMAMDEKLRLNAIIVYCEAGEVDKALVQYGILLRTLRKSGKIPEEIRSLLAQAAAESKPEESIRLMEEELREHPDSASSLNALGYTLADCNRDLPRAKELLERALRTCPDEPAFLDSLAWLHFRKGEYLMALERVSESLDRLPLEAWANAPAVEEMTGHLRAILEVLDEPLAAACLAPAMPK